MTCRVLYCTVQYRVNGAVKASLYPVAGKSVELSYMLASAASVNLVLKLIYQYNQSAFLLIIENDVTE